MKKLILVVSIMLLAFLSLAQYCFGQVEPLQVYFRLRKENIDTRGFVEGCQLIQEVIHVYLHRQNVQMEYFIEQYDDSSRTIRIKIVNTSLYSWNVDSQSWEYVCDLTKNRWYQIVVSYNGATKDYYVDVHYYLSKNRLVYQFHKSNYFPLHCHYVFNYEFRMYWTQTGDGLSIDHLKFESMSNLGIWFTNFHENFDDLDFTTRWSYYEKNAYCKIEKTNWDKYGEQDYILRLWLYMAPSTQTWQDIDFNQGTTYWNPIIYSGVDVPPSYGDITDSTFISYAYEGQGDEWGDVLTAQGKKPHSSQYYKTPLINEWYIPYDTPDNEYLLKVKVMQTDHPYWLAFPPITKAYYPTAGFCVFLIFNMEYERTDGSTAWLFNWEDPDPWGKPNNLHIEIFYERWIFKDGYWYEVTYYPNYHTRTDITTHDSDWHTLLNMYNLGDYNNWHWFTTDLGQIARQEMNADYWITRAKGMDFNFYRFVALKLYTVTVANEVIGCEYGNVKFDLVYLLRYW